MSKHINPDVDQIVLVIDKCELVDTLKRLDRGELRVPEAEEILRSRASLWATIPAGRDFCFLDKTRAITGSCTIKGAMQPDEIGKSVTDLLLSKR